MHAHELLHQHPWSPSRHSLWHTQCDSHTRPRRRSHRCSATGRAVQLSQTVVEAMQQPDEIAVHRTGSVITQAAQALRDSRDWQQLCSCMDLMAQQYTAGSPSSRTTATPAQPQRHTVDSFRARMAAAAAARGSNTSTSTAGAQIDMCTDNTSPPSRGPEWHWHQVSHLVVLGLGSISEAVHGASKGSDRPEGISPRLTYRLQQLALALSLRQVLPGLSCPVLFCDPAFTNWDRQLIQHLGGAVTTDPVVHLTPQAATATSPAGTPSTADTASQCSGSVLYYMPCCPRRLYGQVVEHHLDSHTLHRVAVLGNSFATLADSNVLLQVPSASSSVASARTQLLSTGGGPQQTRHSQDDLDMGLTPHSVLDLVKGGGVLEVPVPDCAAHGVAVALHSFPQPALQGLRNRV